MKVVIPLGDHFSARFVGQLASIIKQTVETVVGERHPDQTVFLLKARKIYNNVKLCSEIIHLLSQR